ncbi:MAG: hypothetical protein AB7S71_06700 [Dongiaceae bacterium]
MKISTTLVAAASLCIGLTAASVGVADDEPHPALAPQGGAAPASAADSGMQPNCLLPGRLRDFHGIVMLAPRQAVTLGAHACAGRGGTPLERAAAAN